MPFDSTKQHRRSVRIKGYDYSAPGAYFVTICTGNRECFFGEIVNGRMHLSVIGATAELCWREIPNHFPHVNLDAFIVMPNHVHGILNWYGESGRGLINQTPADAKWIMMKNNAVPLGKIVRHYKARTTKKIHDSGFPEFLWQRNYHEHIIRNEKELSRIQEYIICNPLQSASDEENPAGEMRGKKEGASNHEV